MKNIKFLKSSARKAQDFFVEYVQKKCAAELCLEKNMFLVYNN